PTIQVGAGEIVPDDMYVAGAQVTIDGQVKGDLVVVGGNVTVRGRVDGDLLAVGGTVIVAGPVGQAFRAAGSEVRITGPVGGDLLAAAGELVTDSGVTVGGETLVRATDLTLAGALGRSLRARGETMTVMGSVAGPALLQAPRLRVTAGSRFDGPLSFETLSLNPVESGAQTLGGIAGSMLQSGNGWQAFWPWLLRWVTAALVGLVLVVLFPQPAAHVADVAMRHPHWRVLAGLGVLFGAPMIAIMGMLTVIALPLGVMLMGVYAAALYLAQLVVAWGAGRWMLARLGDQKTRWKKVVALLVALLAVYGLKALPVAGPYVNFVIVLWGLGAIAIAITQWWRLQQRAAAA
ncbi:MAG: polymer-forming cytoskeletal protein, partial [Candidatus Sericytochromatia bacterium]